MFDRFIIYLQQRLGRIVLLFFVFSTGWYVMAAWGWLRYPFRGVQAWEAVPASAGLVLEMPRPEEALKYLDREPLVGAWARWDLMQRLKEEAVLLDSLLGLQAECEGIFPSARILAVAQNNGAKQVDWLWLLQDYAPRFDAERWLAAAQPLSVQRSVYKGLELWQMDFGAYLGRWTLARYRGLLMCSRLTAAVEAGVAQLDDLASGLPRRSDFGRCLQARNADAPWNLYLNIAEQPLLLSTLTEQTGGSLQALSQTGTWAVLSPLPAADTELDWQGNWQPQSPFWTALARQAPPDSASITRLLPDHIALLAYVGAQDLEHLYESTKTQNYPDFETYVLPWLGQEMAYFCTEPAGDRFAETHFVVLQARSAEQAQRALSRYGDQFGILHQSEYQGFPIVQLAAKDFMQPLWGTALNPLQNPYYICIDNYVVFSNSLINLELYIEKFNFKKPTTDFSGIRGSQFYAWMQPRRAHAFVQAYVREELRPWLARMWQHASACQSLRLRCFGHRGAWECRLGASFGGAAAPEPERRDTLPAPAPALLPGAAPELVWRSELKAPVLYAPLAVRSPYAAESDILVQDSNLVLYRIDLSGAVLWERRLTERILPPIHAIDYRDNGQWQYAFVTKTELMIVDRQGETLKTLPLVKPAYAGLSLLRYEGGERLVVPCATGELYGYDKYGTPWTGWNPLAGMGKVQLPLRCLSDKKTPYFWSANTGGIVRALRFDGLSHFDAFLLGEQAVHLGADSLPGRIAVGGISGKVLVCNLQGKSFTLAAPPELRPPVRFCYADAVGDARKDYIRCDAQRLMVHAYDEQQKFRLFYEYRFDQAQDEVFTLQWTGTGKPCVGTYSKTAGRIYLFDADGKLLPGFPLPGSSRFYAIETPDGLPLLVVANGNQVLAYR